MNEGENVRREITQKSHIGVLLLILIVVITATGCATFSPGGKNQGVDQPVEQPAPTKKELKVGDAVSFNSVDVNLVRELIDWNDVAYYVATQNGNALIGMTREGRLIEVGPGATARVLQISESDIKVRLGSGEQGWTVIDTLSW